MTADEMFKKLGYHLIEEGTGFIIYESKLKYILLMPINKSVQCVSRFGDPEDLYYEELQAIIKKMEELG